MISFEARLDTPTSHPSPVWDTISAPHRMTLGLRAKGPDDCWLELGEDLEQDLRMKDAQLHRQRQQVFVQTSSSKEA